MRKVAVLAEDVHCSNCTLNGLCLPVGIPEKDVARLDALVNQRVRAEKGATLFRAGDDVRAIYAIRSGSIKTQLEDAGGHVQITGFFLPGELIGMDGLLSYAQLSHAIALEDTEVCVIGVEDMNDLASRIPSLHQQLQRLMSREIQRSHKLLMSLGALRSDQRLAAFLLNLSQRLALLGYSATRFVLRMSREEIGNYLGLTIETVSRIFSRFARANLIQVNQRDVCLIDLPALGQLAGLGCPAPARV